MALKATIHKLGLSVADVDRGHYGDYALMIARHPSETETRMMMRVLAFALFAHEDLAFGRGLCVDDEADLWRCEADGSIVCWIDVGQPDEKWIRKACARAEQVVLLSYGRPAEVWWRGIGGKLSRFGNLRVCNVAAEAAEALTGLAARSMRLQCTIQDGQVWLTDGRQGISVEPAVWFGADSRSA